MWEIYDSLIGEIPDNILVKKVVCGSVWTCVCTDAGTAGIAMSMSSNGGDKCADTSNMADGFCGRPLREVALSVKSWDFAKASVGMAAINAWYNTEARIKSLDLYQKQEGHSTFGMDVAGKDIVMIGALKSRSVLEAAGAHVTVLEREDKPDTLPDTAAEYVIPGCDILVITASAFINKTMPRLLELGRGARIVVAGPSAPMSPHLLEFGIHRVTGLVVTDLTNAPDFVSRGEKQQPYILGEKFCVQ